MNVSVADETVESENSVPIEKSIKLAEIEEYFKGLGSDHDLTNSFTIDYKKESDYWGEEYGDDSSDSDDSENLTYDEEEVSSVKKSLKDVLISYDQREAAIKLYSERAEIQAKDIIAKANFERETCILQATEILDEAKFDRDTKCAKMKEDMRVWEEEKISINKTYNFENKTIMLDILKIHKIIVESKHVLRSTVINIIINTVNKMKIFVHFGRFILQIQSLIFISIFFNQGPHCA